MSKDQNELIESIKEIADRLNNLGFKLFEEDKCGCFLQKGRPMSDERDYQYENDLEMLKMELKQQISPGQIIRRMTNQFRAADDHVYAIHVNRSASDERDYFYRDIVKSEALFASGHRLCFKNIRDIRDFLAFFDERLEQESRKIDDYCDSAYPIDKKEKLEPVLKDVMNPHFEGKLEVDDLYDVEVTTITRYTNFRDKE